MLFRSSYRFYSFPVLARILLFFGTHTDSTIFRYSRGEFFDTRWDSTFSRCAPGFYHFLVLTQIRPFSSTRRDSFFYTWRDSTFSRYLPGFYHLWVLTLIRPFSGIHWDKFSILARNLPFAGTRPDSTIYQYSH